MQTNQFHSWVSKNLNVDALSENLDFLKSLKQMSSKMFSISCAIKCMAAGVGGHDSVALVYVVHVPGVCTTITTMDFVGSICVKKSGVERRIFHA